MQRGDVRLTDRQRRCGRRTPCAELVQWAVNESRINPIAAPPFLGRQKARPEPTIARRHPPPPAALPILGDLPQPPDPAPTRPSPPHRLVGLGRSPVSDLGTM